MRLEARSICGREFFSQIFVHQLVLDDFQLFEKVAFGEQPLFKLRQQLARQLAEEVCTNRLLFWRV